MMRIDEIKARVDATTPGGWEWVGFENNDPSLVVKIGDETSDVMWTDFEYNRGDCIRVSKEDADFIANAPGDMRYLLAKVKQANTLIEYIYRAVETNGVEENDAMISWKCSAKVWMEDTK